MEDLPSLNIIETHFAYQQPSISLTKKKTMDFETLSYAHLVIQSPICVNQYIYIFLLLFIQCQMNSCVESTLLFVDWSYLYLSFKEIQNRSREVGKGTYKTAERGQKKKKGNGYWRIHLLNYL